MAADDLPAARSHVDLAVRHLESASALIDVLVQDPVLADPERLELSEDIADAGLLIDRLRRTISGVSFESELDEFLHGVD